MTMIDGMATLVISSPDHPAHYVTSVLGLEPDWSAEVGDARPRQGDTGAEPIRRPVYDESIWALEVDSNPGTKMAIDEDDAKGFATLAVLLGRLLGRGQLLNKLKAYYKVELTWYGTAGASQTGFVLPISLLSDLAELGLDVNCTVYSQEDTSVKPALHVGAPAVNPLVAGLVPQVLEGPGTGVSSAPPVQKTEAQLAAEQLLVDSLIAEQLHEQGIIETDR